MGSSRQLSDGRTRICCHSVGACEEKRTRPNREAEIGTDIQGGPGDGCVIKRLSRVFFTIAKDGLLPKMFSEVHPTLGTPYKSQLLIGIVVAVVAALTPIDVLGEMVSIGTLFAFALVCGAVVYLRKSDAEIFRPFRTPAVPWVPTLGIAFSLLLMVFLPWETWLRLIVWLAIGLAIYFAYGRSHSVLMNGDRR
jgi:APA family basic amino acid/polyamine antiporter